jgi:hypothetical protein
MKVSQADDYVGDVTIDFVAYHKDSKPVSMKVEYSLDADASWHTITEGTNSSGISGLFSSRNGFWHKLVWATTTDLPNSSRTAKLRFVPYAFGKGTVKFGEIVQTYTIKVRNFTMGSLGCAAILASADNDTDALSPAIFALSNGGIVAVWESRNSSDSIIRFSKAPEGSVVFSPPVSVNPTPADKNNESLPGR